jgi:hypothetical protein
MPLLAVRGKQPITFVLDGQSLSYSRANDYKPNYFLKVLCPKNTEPVKSIINANKDLLFEALRGRQQKVAYNPQ